MRALAILILLFGAAATASAMPGESSKPEKPPTTGSDWPAPSSAPDASPARKEAEQSYKLAYEDVEKAKKDLAAGKAKNAEKRLKRVLERAQKAVSLDPQFHEAWNLVGYSSRKLGDYANALIAYEKCLGIKWDYAPAREYLGEAYVEKGEIAKAREQLAILEKLNAAKERDALGAALAEYVKAHPEAATAAESEKEAPEAAPPDTTR